MFRTSAALPRANLRCSPAQGLDRKSGVVGNAHEVRWLAAIDAVRVALTRCGDKPRASSGKAKSATGVDDMGNHAMNRLNH